MFKFLNKIFHDKIKLANIQKLIIFSEKQDKVCNGPRDILFDEN